MQIVEVKEMSSAVMEAFERLMPQLSTSARVPTWDELNDLIQSKASVLFAAVETENEGKIVGTLTLAVFRIPTGMRSWIEDVIVDSDERGRGIGEMLVHAAVDYARSQGVKTVDLTSRPSREAANRLYRRCGFQQRETNIYRFTIE